MKKRLICLCSLFFLLITINASYANSVTLQPGPEGKDSTEYHNYTYPHNHGDHDYLEVQRFPGGEMYTYIEFDLSSVSFTNIGSASLQLYVMPSAHTINPGGLKVYANRITEAWGEMTIVDGNLPAVITDQPVQNEGIIQDNVWISFDITQLVQNWVNGTFQNHGVRIQANEPSSMNIYFYSSDYMGDASLRPKLVITEGSSLENPVANAGPDQMIITNEVMLDGSLSNDPDGVIVSYGWELIHRDTPSYNRTATGVSPIISNLEPGTYDVTLTVTDDEGLTGTDEMILSVFECPCTQGPPGPQGPEGPQGPQGEPGIGSISCDWSGWREGGNTSCNGVSCDSNPGFRTYCDNGKVTQMEMRTYYTVERFW